jgi:hypothetical protein
MLDGQEPLDQLMHADFRDGMEAVLARRAQRSLE